MSLVNQVLKDLEQRHAAEMQAQDLGLAELRYASIPPPRKKRNYTVLLSAVLLILLGVLTVAGVYIFEAWDTQHKPVPIAVTPPEPAVQIHPVDAAALQAGANVQTVATTQTTLAEPAPIAQPVAEVKPAPVPVALSKAKPIETDEAQGTLAKQFVPLSSEQRAGMAYQEGHDFVRRHDYRKAESALRAALSYEPAHLKARELLCGVYISQGRWIEANELLQEGVNIAPQHHTFVKLYARSLMQLKRDAQAIALLEKYRPSAAQDPEHYALLAALHQRQQNHELAARLYSDILKHQPKMGIWWVGMGISLEALGDSQQAAAAYQQARQTGTLQGDVAHYTDNRLAALDAIKYPID